MADMTLEELMATPPPERHTLFRLGPLSYYWIWINEGSKHEHRGYILNWCTHRRMIHLTDWRWWRPLKLFPRAMIGSFKASAKPL